MDPEGIRGDREGSFHIVCSSSKIVWFKFILRFLFQTKRI